MFLLGSDVNVLLSVIEQFAISYLDRAPVITHFLSAVCMNDNYLIYSDFVVVRETVRA